MIPSPAALTAGHPATQYEYSYDCDGWRSEKRSYTGGNVERVRYLYYGNDLLAEVKETVNANGEATWELARGYHWMGGGVGEAWRLLSVQDYERGTVALPGYDGRGNIVTWTNGATGELIGTADYGPYGERFDVRWVTPSDEASYDRFGFGTEYRDETGLIYYGARYYSPALGRFLSRDPAGVAGSGVNLYAFCGGDPVNKLELYGLCSGGYWGGSSGAYFSNYGGYSDSYRSRLGGKFDSYSSYQPSQPDSSWSYSGAYINGRNGNNYVIGRDDDLVVDDEIVYLDPFEVTAYDPPPYDYIKDYNDKNIIEEINAQRRALSAGLYSSFHVDPSQFSSYNFRKDWIRTLIKAQRDFLNSLGLYDSPFGLTKDQAEKRKDAALKIIQMYAPGLYKKIMKAIQDKKLVIRTVGSFRFEVKNTATGETQMRTAGGVLISNTTKSPDLLVLVVDVSQLNNQLASVLIHELTHMGQDPNLSEMEKELPAYKAQFEFLKSQGMPLDSLEQYSRDGEWSNEQFREIFGKNSISAPSGGIWKKTGNVDFVMNL
jgi:RHS repeat-associated protein